MDKSTNSQGLLPIRVLQSSILECLHYFGDIDHIEDEIKYCELNPKIKWKVSDTPIHDFACITPNHQIEICENACQYLWCMCFSISIFFYEIIQKQLLNFEIDEDLKRNAINCFQRGIGLLTNFERNIFFELPNPETEEWKNSVYVSNTNSVFCSALTFILLHEFGHQYYGHLTYKPDSEIGYIKDELAADDYAFDRFYNTLDLTIKNGITIALLSFVFSDDTMKGGAQHPDPDNRLERIMIKMGLHDNDPLWGLVASAFDLWAFHYDLSIEPPYNMKSYKNSFDYYKTEIERSKKFKV